MWCNTVFFFLANKVLRKQILQYCISFTELKNEITIHESTVTVIHKICFKKAAVNYERNLRECVYNV